MAVKRTAAVTDEAEQKLQLKHPTAEIIWERAIEVFGDEQKAQDWMRTPLPILDQHTPEEYATSNVLDKQREVLTILGRIDYGMFS